MKKSIRLQDIAESLNLSISTVSKALNNSPEISQNTKNRVLELAKLKHYIPNVSAQILKGQKTRIIGVVLPSLNSTFYTDALHAIEERTNYRNYRLLLCISNESHTKEVDCVEKLIQAQVDGILISPSIETYEKEEYKHLVKIQDYDKSLVLLDRITEDIPCDKVSENQTLLIEKLSLELYYKGCRKIGLMAHEFDLKKIQEYKNAVKLEALPDLFLEIIKKNKNLGDISELIKKKKFDAIIISDEQLALELAQSIKKLRRGPFKEPELICLTPVNFQKMTSSHINWISRKGTEQGKTSADLLMDRIEGLLYPKPLKFIL